MKIQKRLAGQVMNVSPKRVRFDNDRLADIKEAITKTDIRLLVGEKAISRVQEKGVSRGRARKIKVQKSKGLRKGPGSRQAKPTARLPRKEKWMSKIRSQRTFLSELKSKGIISSKTYRDIYLKSKGGFFRSARHIKLYLEEHKLFLAKDLSKKDEGSSVVKKAAKKTTKKAIKKSAKKAVKKNSKKSDDL
jgi:large subunit ribosomal protein L19e